MISPEVPDSTNAADAGSAIIEHVGILLVAAFSCADAVARDPSSDNVHDLRVASRRAREALSVFKDLYRGKDLRRLKKALRSVTQKWGPVRDADVLTEYLRGVSAGTQEGAVCRSASFAAGYGAGLQVASFKAARKAAKKGMLSKREELGRSAARLKEVPAELLSTGRFAHEALEERAARFRCHLPDAFDPSHHDVHHSMRIATKHFRYSVETLRDAGFIDPAPDALAALEEYQDTLGALHDRDVATEFVESLRDDGLLPRVDAAQLLDAIGEDRAEYFERFHALLERHPPETLIATPPRSPAP